MPPRPDLKVIWLELTRRHLDMAESLGKDGFYDGGLFHAYHAFECFASAGLWAKGHNPERPPRRRGGGARSSIHVEKLDWFADEYSGLAVASSAGVIRTYMCGFIGAGARENEVRNACLYHEAGNHPPWLRFSQTEFDGAYRQISKLVQDFAATL